MKISAIATLLLLAPVSGRFFRAGGLKRILLEDSETPSARLAVELDADEGIDLFPHRGEDPGLSFSLESEGASFGLEAAFGSDTPTYAPTNAPCSICGEGYLVTRPDDKAPVPGEPTCGILQFSAESGDFTPAQCAELLTKELSDACGCEEDVAYEMSEATSGQETNTSITVSCSICADGFMVTKPNVAGVDPDNLADLAITCGDIESAAKKAEFTRDECAALKTMEGLSVTCGCAEDGESHIGIRQPGQSGTEGVSDRSNYKGAIAQGMATSTKADQGPIASSIDGTGCSIGVEIKCIPPTDSEFDTCDDHLTPVLDECDSAPTQLLFKFRGGICDKYEGPQDTNLYMCDDFGSGPATVIGESNYIEAMPPRKVGEPYFSGPVIVGENFVMKAREGGPLEEEILVLVYEDETKTTILQMLVFHTTCDVDLNLDERYGTLKLVGFTDKDLEANMIKTVAYEVTIKNLSNGEFTIEHVVNIADGMKDLLGDGNTLKLGGGGEESIVEEFTVNLMVKRTIQTSVTVSGTQGLDQCVASGEMEIFIPGY